MKTKKCSRCGEDLALSEFNPLRKGSDKLKAECKRCANKRSILWRKENPDKQRQSTINWEQKNIEYVQEKRKLYYEENIEYFQNHNKEWYDNNKEKAKEIDKKKCTIASDGYVRRILKQENFHESLITPKMIEVKRGIIKVKRIIKQIKNKQNYE